MSDCIFSIGQYLKVDLWLVKQWRPVIYMINSQPLESLREVFFKIEEISVMNIEQIHFWVIWGHSHLGHFRIWFTSYRACFSRLRLWLWWWRTIGRRRTKIIVVNTDLRRLIIISVDFLMGRIFKLVLGGALSQSNIEYESASQPQSGYLPGGLGGFLFGLESFWISFAFDSHKSVICSLSETLSRTEIFSSSSDWFPEVKRCAKPV